MMCSGDFLRGELAPQRLARLNGVFLDATAVGLPAVDSLDTAVSRLARTAWWELGLGDHYLWEHLIKHLLDAGRHSDAEDVASDLRWLEPGSSTLGQPPRPLTFHC